MATVGAYEAKTKFSELLERVANGESITITRHGKPVAELRPSAKLTPEQAKKAIADVNKIRDEANVTNVSWDELKGWMAKDRR